MLYDSTWQSAAVFNLLLLSLRSGICCLETAETSGTYKGVTGKVLVFSTTLCIPPVYSERPSQCSSHLLTPEAHGSPRQDGEQT